MACGSLLERSTRSADAHRRPPAHAIRTQGENAEVQYLGGKSSVGIRLAPFIQQALERANTKTLIEPFVGGFNIVNRLPSQTLGICSDSHPGLKSLYDAIKRGWQPPLILTQERYAELRVSRDWDNPETAFAAFGCTYGGKEWGGYARQRLADGQMYDYARSAARSLERKRAAISRCTFSTRPYQDTPVPRNSVVYCDPPYLNATFYPHTSFNHEQFLQWAQEVASHSTVLVSEFEQNLPTNWPRLWTTTRSTKTRRGTQYFRTEILAQVLP